MNILIPDDWLRDYLKTPATSKQIAECLSLSGPSVEKFENNVYFIEVTTNRVDCASVFGIAHEAAAILPTFGYKATLKKIPLLSYKLKSRVKYLTVKIDQDLCFRFSAVLIKNVRISDSPLWLRQRLLNVGVRPINNIVDISNYIMHEIGQPVHTFDFRKIGKSKMLLRPSDKGEKITTLDGKTHILAGGDIVIEDGYGKLIDLAGIMGGENSAVDVNTKDVLLFVQTYNPISIRKTSMSLAKRSEASELFEKGLDPELVPFGISLGIGLLSKITGGKADSDILDIYAKPYQKKTVLVGLEFIEKHIGIKLNRNEISTILTALGFTTKWKVDNLEVSVPSFRSGDIKGPVDIVEEIARLYGYYKIPSELMTGLLPEPLINSPFAFETKIKNILKGYGGIEIYTLSLVDKNSVLKSGALKLKNPLGTDSEYLRTSLLPSLVKAGNDNSGEENPFHLFELANTYIPNGRHLPQEVMTLAGIMVNTTFVKARGIIEALLAELHSSIGLIPEEGADFLPGKRLVLKYSKKEIGEFGELENGYFFYKIRVEDLRKTSIETGRFFPLPIYPPQIEDLTLNFPEKTKIGEVIEAIKAVDKLLGEVRIIGTYKNNYTFRFWYQHSNKTLTNSEVQSVRNNILKMLNDKFGAFQ